LSAGRIAGSGGGLKAAVVRLLSFALAAILKLYFTYPNRFAIEAPTSDFICVMAVLLS
jgi:hypothetical protein